MLSISLGDILKTLDQFKNWKRINEAPDKLDALEKRVAALEAQLGAPRPPGLDPCALCGGAMKVQHEYAHPTFGQFGDKERVMACQSEGCGHETTVRVRQRG